MRYEIIEESVPGHGCCYTHTILDTERMDWTQKKYYPICEARDAEDAKLICDALNATEK